MTNTPTNLDVVKGILNSFAPEFQDYLVENMSKEASKLLIARILAKNSLLKELLIEEEEYDKRLQTELESLNAKKVEVSDQEKELEEFMVLVEDSYSIRFKAIDSEENLAYDKFLVRMNQKAIKSIETTSQIITSLKKTNKELDEFLQDSINNDFVKRINDIQNEVSMAEKISKTLKNEYSELSQAISFKKTELQDKINELDRRYELLKSSGSFESREAKLMKEIDQIQIKIDVAEATKHSDSFNSTDEDTEAIESDNEESEGEIAIEFINFKNPNDFPVIEELNRSQETKKNKQKKKEREEQFRLYKKQQKEVEKNQKKIALKIATMGQTVSSKAINAPIAVPLPKKHDSIVSSKNRKRSLSPGSVAVAGNDPIRKKFAKPKASDNSFPAIPSVVVEENVQEPQQCPSTVTPQEIEKSSTVESCNMEVVEVPSNDQIHAENHVKDDIVKNKQVSDKSNDQEMMQVEIVDDDSDELPDKETLERSKSNDSIFEGSLNESFEANAELSDFDFDEDVAPMDFGDGNDLFSNDKSNKSTADNDFNFFEDVPTSDINNDGFFDNMNFNI